MAPFIVLVIVTLTARLIGAFGVAYLGSWPDALAVGLAAMFLVTSGAHFAEPRRDGLIAIVPRGLPAPAAIITVTGALEILGAVGLLVPGSAVPHVRQAAAICLALLLIAMFPANVYAASAQRHPAAPHTPLGLRTALQVVFLAAAVVVAAVG